MAAMKQPQPGFPYIVATGPRVDDALAGFLYTIDANQFAQAQSRTTKKAVLVLDMIRQGHVNAEWRNGALIEPAPTLARGAAHLREQMQDPAVQAQVQHVIENYGREK